MVFKWSSSNVSSRHLDRGFHSGRLHSTWSFERRHLESLEKPNLSDASRGTFTDPYFLNTSTTLDVSTRGDPTTS